MKKYQKCVVFILFSFVALSSPPFANAENINTEKLSILSQIVSSLEQILSSLESKLPGLSETQLSVATVYDGSKAICPSSIVEGIGIGDGCTTSYGNYNLAYLPDIGLFKGTFTGACNNHDKCYTTLGNNTASCNSAFLTDMKSACDSKYNKYLRPVEYLECRRVAEMYKIAVDVYAQEKDPVPGLQEAALAESRRLKTAIDSGYCATTPERSTLYSPAFIESINGTFMSKIGRKPTMSEFLGAVHYGSIDNFNGYVVSNPVLWNNNLSTFASSRALYNPPVVNWGLNGETLQVINPQPGAEYTWVIDRFKKTTGTTKYVGSLPQYDIVVPLKGYLMVNLNGLTNYSIIDTLLYIKGTCATTKGSACF